MIDRTSRAALLALVLVAFAGCSKTEDSAPDRTIFGSSPIIESASLEVNPYATATCDFTDAFNAALYQSGLALSMPTTITATYTELIFRATVSDPEGLGDILAVTASFKDVSNPSTPIEDSLVLLDDGGSEKFPFYGKSSLFPQDCSTIGGIPFCQQKVYDLNAGDPVADDGTYTRAFYFARNADPFNLIQDCVAQQKGVAVKAIQFADIGFLIEAVDRAGNLVAWPDELKAVDEGISLECNGDACFCCALLVNLDFSQCIGLPGLQGTCGG